MTASGPIHPAHPGNLVDLHIHGAFGVDLVTAEAHDLDRLARELQDSGYASFLPTLIPLALDDLEQTLQRLAPWIESRTDGDGRGALPLGVHYEGPFVSPKRAGALHARSFLDARDRPSVARFLRLTEAAPGRRMITLAPEIAGGVELAAEFAARRFLVSIGHTDADTRTLRQAVEAGARHMTHFCNAMRPLHHRDPGPIAFGLTCDDVTLDVIADFVHLHPDILALILKARGPDSVALISDAMPAAGLGDGRYRIWGEDIGVMHGEARNSKGSIAGSVALLGTGVSNLAGLPGEHLTPEQAHRCASQVPLRILGT